MAQASRAITPKDPGGPWGQRIGVNVAGSSSRSLQVAAFVTKRNNPSDWWRYSIVVLNSYAPLPHAVFAVLLRGGNDGFEPGTMASTGRGTHKMPLQLSHFEDNRYGDRCTLGRLLLHDAEYQATFTFPVGVTTLWWFAAPK